MAAGEEGFVLRKKDSAWQCGKRPAWATIKCKQMDTIDLVCTRAIEATKEYTGKELNTWEYWIDLEGNPSGLTDEMRAHLDDYVGKVVALQCMSIDRKEKTLRHPIVKAWRDDKNAAECKLSEVFH